VPETTGSRTGHDRRDGRSNELQPIVAIVFLPLPRRKGEANAVVLGGGLRREERLLSRMRDCVDRVGTYDEGEFLFLPHVSLLIGVSTAFSC
jgi:hypothetical protein